MITTQHINSIGSVPIELKDYETINILKWKFNEWAPLCPYVLKTDGNESCVNPGNILFENYYQ